MQVVACTGQAAHCHGGGAKNESLAGLQKGKRWKAFFLFLSFFFWGGAWEEDHGSSLGNGAQKAWEKGCRKGLRKQSLGMYTRVPDPLSPGTASVGSNSAVGVASSGRSWLPAQSYCAFGQDAPVSE